MCLRSVSVFRVLCVSSPIALIGPGVLCVSARACVCVRVCPVLALIGLFLTMLLAGIILRGIILYWLARAVAVDLQYTRSVEYVTSLIYRAHTCALLFE